ncbi:MAG: hypothetical protein CMJ68_24165 [Planctomycetaceae bacterium]|nr:hypothetical protein [Planctomycetaceae bacterium]
MTVPPKQRVVVEFTADHIIPGTTQEAVVAIATPHRVVSQTTIDRVVPGIPEKGIREITASDAVGSIATTDGDFRVDQIRKGRRIQARKIHHVVTDSGINADRIKLIHGQRVGIGGVFDGLGVDQHLVGHLVDRDDNRIGRGVGTDVQLTCDRIENRRHAQESP